MADKGHLKILHQGVDSWNNWRTREPEARPDLSKSVLTGVNLSGADLSQVHAGRADFSVANLRMVNLSESYFVQSSFHGADLRNANLSRARLWDGVVLVKADMREAKLERASLITANLAHADLRGAQLFRTDLSGANLSDADLTSASLLWAQLVGTNLERATLIDCNVFGTSAWDLKLDGAKQQNLIITYPGSPAITVDNIEVAQFIYLLLNNQRIRHAIDTVTSKVVLILGRFTETRKTVLDAVRDELRRRDLTPILFDFDKPASKDLTGAVETLARMARFIIADLTDPSSIPHELATIVPFLRTTPVLPLRLKGSGGYTMFDDLARSYRWVLKVHEYADGNSLISDLPKVIAPADKMADRFARRRNDLTAGQGKRPGTRKGQK